MSNDTVFAIATPPGRSGVAVLRISGPRTQEALVALGVKPLRPRHATRADLHVQGQLIDQSLALWFPAPASFTGEDVAELHVHGSRAVLSALLSALGEVPGLRLAEAGEFTRRAFLNGKMDLTAVEGLADLLEAETQGQLRQALRQLRGEHAAHYERLRAQALKALARLEAYIDFPDEDIPASLMEQVRQDIGELQAQIAALLELSATGRRIRDGITIILLGAPNAGKSTLLNALAKRDAAIVSPQAGTTRDIIEVHLDLQGYAVTLLDTAGLRESTDPIEQEGIARALARAEKADICLFLVDATQPPAPLPALPLESLVVYTKIDQVAAPQGAPGISARDGQGMHALLAQLEEKIATLVQGQEMALVTRERHKIALLRASEALERVFLQPYLELQCEELRLCAVEIGKITGKIDVDELLGHIFSEFCIGK